MKQRFALFLLPLLLWCVMAVPAIPAAAATTNFSEAIPGIQVVAITMNRAVTAVSAPVIARMQFPFKAEVLGVSASCETADYASTDETYKIDVKEGANSIFSTPINMLAADTVYEGAIADRSIADEAVVTVVLDVAGTTPSVEDVTVLLTVRRTN
ncbi:MAG: hypothetical protein IH614_06245 [Desulfuromonadales bacterium]|nr:hypothetical protein [Desulfuromonadales bacterium]